MAFRASHPVDPDGESASASGSLDLESWRSRQHIAELLAVFVVGFALMQFIYSATGGASGVRANLSGNDCFYHV